MARSYLPPGFRFHPTDEELLVHYLKRKVAGRRVNDGVIGEIEFYKFEPADLPGLATLQSRDPEWFFFNVQDKKYSHGARTNRTTRVGYWKATGKDRKIIAASCMGTKKTLIYYFGRAPHGERTDWVMHEYRLDEDVEKRMNSAKSFVLCRVRRKGGLGPRNGEQYGAPVLEGIEENEAGISTSYPVEGEFLLPSAKVVTGECKVFEAPLVTVDEGAGAGDYIDSFLQALASCEDQEKQPFQDEILSLGELLGLADNLSDFTVMEPAHAVTSQYMGFGGEDEFNDLFHPADQESAMLEEMLHLASGQVGIVEGSRSRMAVQEPSDGQVLDDVHDGDFIELADLEGPCEEQGTLACGDIEEYFYGMDNGVEIPMGTGLSQERPHVQSLQSFGDGQNFSCLPHLEACGMLNEQLASEVPLNSSQGLSVLDSIDTRLLTSDDGGGFSDDLPSGLVLNTDEVGGFTANSASVMTHSHSHLSRADAPPEAHLPGVSSNPRGIVDMQDGGLSLASVSPQEGAIPAYGQCGSICRNARQLEAVEQSKFTSGLPNNDNKLKPSVSSLAPIQSLPSPLQLVVSQILCMADSFPASAGGSERCQPLGSGSSKYLALESKAAMSGIQHEGCLNINGTALHLRVDLVDIQHSGSELVDFQPEMELQWSIAPNVSAKRTSFTNGLSIFLFNMTTLAVIMFCMFRSFCRLTRTHCSLMI